MKDKRNWRNLSNDELIAYAKEFVDKNKIKSRSTLQMEDCGLYRTLERRQLLESAEFNEILPKVIIRNWQELTNEELLNHGKKFIEENEIESRNQLRKEDCGFYNVLYKRRLLESEGFNEILPSKLRNWKDLSTEELLAYAKEFVDKNNIKNRLALQKEDSGLYKILERMDLLESAEFNEILPSKLRNWKDLSNEDLIDYAKELVKDYNIESRSALQKEDCGFYDVLKNRRLLESAEFNEILPSKILCKEELIDKIPFQETEIPEESLLEDDPITNFNPDESKASLFSLLMSTVPLQSKGRRAGRDKTEKREYLQKGIVKIEYTANGETFDVTEEYTLSENQFLLPMIWKKLHGLRGKELKELAETEIFRKFADEYSTTQTFIETNIISRVINKRLGKKISIGTGTGADLTPEDIGFEINPVFAEIAKENDYNVINENAANIDYADLKKEGYEAVYFPQSLTDILPNELETIVNNISGFDKIAFTLPHKNNIPDGLIERFGLRDENKINVKIDYIFDDETKRTKKYAITILEPYSGPKKLKGALEELELPERNRISRIIYEIANQRGLYLDDEDMAIGEEIFELPPRETIKRLQSAKTL